MNWRVEPSPKVLESALPQFDPLDLKYCRYTMQPHAPTHLMPLSNPTFDYAPDRIYTLTKFDRFNDQLKTHLTISIHLVLVRRCSLDLSTSHGDEFVLLKFVPFWHRKTRVYP